MSAEVSAVVILIVYLVINFTFISIALELALTLITTTALISISAFFLDFSALSATSAIARQTLDVILGNCFRVLGIYLVVGAGSHTIQAITEAIPTQLISFDQYVWIVASCLLFWLLAKNFPNQLARIASIAVHDHQGTDSVALATSLMRTGGQLGPAAKTALAASGVPQLAKVAASSAYNAVMHVAKNRKEGSGLVESIAKGAVQNAVDVSKATIKTLGDHALHAANKSVGGYGMAKSHVTYTGVSERIYASTENARMQMPNMQPQPSSQAATTAHGNQSTGMKTQKHSLTDNDINQNENKQQIDHIPT